MKWLEVIELRSVNSNRDSLEALLRKLVAEVNNEPNKQSVTVYRAMLNYDFSIHISHDSKEVEKSGSALGLHLTSAFKDTGLVNHSIWVEIDDKQ